MKFQDTKQRLRLERGILAGVCAIFAMLVCAAVILAIGGAIGIDDAGIACATLPFLGFAGGVLRDKDGGDLGGGGGDFEGKVIGMLDAQAKAQGEIKHSIEDLTKNYDRLDKETKRAFEDLTKAKNQYEGLDSDISAVRLSLKQVMARLAAEQRLATGGTFGQRFVADRERAKSAFAAVCELVGKADWARKAIGEDATPGSTLITEELQGDVYDSLARHGRWSTLGVRPVGTKSSKIPVKTARPVAQVYLTEADTLDQDSTKAGTSVSLEMEVYAVLLNVSMQLLEDAEIDVVADVLDDFIEALNYRLDFCAFQGDGTADKTHGGVTGLINFGTAATATATRTTVAATKLDDWVRCLTTVDDAVLTRQARWWVNPSLLAAALGVTDSNGRSIFLTATEAPGFGGIGSILGYPVTMVSALPSTDDASAKIAAFGDPRAMAVGVRKQFTFETSDHAGWTTLQRSFRGVMRADAIGCVATALAVLTLPAS